MPSQRTAVSASARVRENQRRRRAEILRAALGAFRDKGYRATTLDDIAERIGVGKTALYHYFPDREAILYECHRESLAELLRLLARVESWRASATERLAWLIRDHVRVMTETLAGSPLAFEVSALSPPRRAEVIAGRDRYEGALRRLIADGIAAGEFRLVDPKVAAFVILGAINWIAGWYRPGGDLATEDLGAQFAEHLLGGLTCR